ncbi:hypothetical protein BSKO_03937 [Bryopsis sp. KO-2023]|nr:hypothetical protein BSKO_03937 [Bryopsis sp. KO-2023]
MKVVVLAGTFCGVGTTSIAVGLMRELREKGLRVQGFKVGPGFAENELFEAATGRMAVNLDPWMVPKDYLLTCVHRYAPECDIAVVDGCEGLYDSRNDSDGEWTTAELAKVLGAPVLLVVDAAPMGHSCAAMVRGFESFDKRVRIAGVVLNRVSDQEHANLLAKAMAKGGVKAGMLGWMPTSNNIIGLIERNDRRDSPVEGIPAESYVQALGEMVSSGFDLDTILEIGSTSKLPKCPHVRSAPPKSAVRIAVAKDAAFSFYYHENFVLLEAGGAELVFFSPLDDEELPSDIAAVYFGGGHPECYTQRLSENKRLISAVQAFASAGGVVYAEGGGVLYLSKSVQTIGEFPVDMVGLFPFRTRMDDSPMWQSTYIEVEMLRNCSLFPSGGRVLGHVCHQSQVVEEIVRSFWSGTEQDISADYDFAYRLHQRGGVGAPTLEGYSWKNVLASYVHLQFASNPTVVSSLVSRCQQVDVAFVSEEVQKAVGMTFKKGNPYMKSLSPVRPISFDIGHRKGSFLREGSMDHLSGIASKRFSTDCHVWKKSSLCSSASSTGSEFSSKGEFMIKEKEKGSSDDFCWERAKRSESVLASTTGCGEELRRSASFGDVAVSAVGRNANNKIVALSPSSAEIAFMLGLGDRVVGMTNLCNFPDGAQEGKTMAAKTKFDPGRLDRGRLEMKLKEFWCKKESAFELNEEYLRQEQPGLVLVDENGDPNLRMVERSLAARKGSFGGLTPIQPTKILSHKIHRLSEVFDYMIRVGEAAHVTRSSEILVDGLRNRVAKIGSLVLPCPPREKVVVLTGLNPLVVGGYWIPEMVTLAGGEFDGGHTGKPHQRITWDQLQDMAPEVLILAAGTWEETKQEIGQLASLPGWWSLPAMKTGQLYACEHSLFTIPGPRLVEGIELLARILHPSVAGNYGKKGMATSCILRNGRRCRPCNLSRHFCTLL